MIHRPSFNRLEALKLQRKMLLEREERIKRMIETIDQTIRYEKGEIQISNEEKFKGFDFSNNQYEKEARERWGDKAIDRSNESLNKMSPAEQKQLEDDMNAIFRKLASLRNEDLHSKAAQDAIDEWYQIISIMMGDTCNIEVFQSLGEMYVADERFTKNIDQFGSGLAQFMRDAMTIYAKNNR